MLPFRTLCRPLAVLLCAGALSACAGLAQDDGPVVPIPAQTKYCYRTLAAVTCYEQPSPHEHDTLMGVVVPRVGIDAR